MLMPKNVLKKHIIVKIALTLIVPNCKANSGIILRVLMHEGSRKKEETCRKGIKRKRRNVSKTPPFSYLIPKVFKNNLQVK